MSEHVVEGAESAHRGKGDMLTISCRSCGRTIGLEFVAAGIVSLVCARCKTVNRIQFDRPALLETFFDWARICTLYQRPQFATY